jgi:hypothetical protein
VPVFRDLPAALDSESPLIVLPNPFLLAVGVGAELVVDGVADASFQAPHRFLAGLPLGLLVQVVGAAGGSWLI